MTEFAINKKFKMKLFIQSIFFIFFTTTSFSQEMQKINFKDTLQSYFDYSKLNGYACNNFPPGIYSITFKVDKYKNADDFTFSDESLRILNNILEETIKLSVKKVALDGNEMKYLQLIYFDVRAWCKVETDSTAIDKNIYKEVSNILLSRLHSIENSFKKIIYSPDEFIVLKTVIITDYYSPLPKRTAIDLPASKNLPESNIKNIENKLREIGEIKKNEER